MANFIRRYFPLDRAAKSLHWMRNLAPRIDGSITVIGAIAFPGLLLLSAGVMDYAKYTNHRALLQSAVDAASLAAAKEMSLTDTKIYSLETVATKAVEANVAASAVMSASGRPSVTATVDGATLAVHVTASQPYARLLGGFAALLPATVSVSASATVVGRPNICVLALESQEMDAIALSTSARLTGDGCSVFSNSNSFRGITVSDNATLKANSVCSAGGIGGSGSVQPAGYQDCPQFDDPLASRAEPTIGLRCDYLAKVVVLQSVKLRPGVYCGGLTILGFAKVTLEPGDYIIRDGIFAAEGFAEIVGENVSLFLGPTATMLLGPNSSVRLSAPKAGPMAGILIFGSRQQPRLLTHTILSRNAQHMVGTIYLPTSTFIVDGRRRCRERICLHGRGRPPAGAALWAAPRAQFELRPDGHTRA